MAMMRTISLRDQETGEELILPFHNYDPTLADPEVFYAVAKTVIAWRMPGTTHWEADIYGLGGIEAWTCSEL